jgi:hypothetical protein
VKDKDLHIFQGDEERERRRIKNSKVPGLNCCRSTLQHPSKRGKKDNFPDFLSPSRRKKVWNFIFFNFINLDNNEKREGEEKYSEGLTRHHKFILF